MTTLDALATQWAAISTTNPGATIVQRLAILNALTVTGSYVDVPANTAMLYLASQGKLAALQIYAAKSYDSLSTGGTLTPAQNAAAQVHALSLVQTFTSFNTSNPAVFAAVQSMLTAVAGDPASTLTTTDVAALMSFATVAVPWWQANGFSGPITPTDLARENLS